MSDCCTSPPLSVLLPPCAASNQQLPVASCNSCQLEHLISLMHFCSNCQLRLVLPLPQHLSPSLSLSPTPSLSLRCHKKLRSYDKEKNVVKNVSIARQHEAGNKGAALSATLAATLATFATFVVTFSQAALTQPPCSLPSHPLLSPLTWLLVAQQFLYKLQKLRFLSRTRCVSPPPPLPL